MQQTSNSANGLDISNFSNIIVKKGYQRQILERTAEMPLITCNEIQA